MKRRKTIARGASALLLLVGLALPDLKTIARFAGTLEVERIIPGHGAPTTGAILGRYLRYLSELMNSVRGAIRDGQTLEETLASMPIWERYAPPADAGRFGPFLAGLHRLNLQRTYQELNGR